MWIVAIAWIYVVGLMALTETSIVAGVMTFLGYCVLPLSILFYLTGGRGRRARRERVALLATGASLPSEDNKVHDSSESSAERSSDD